MPAYEITFARSASKELQALPRPIRERILEKIEQLAAKPRPYGNQKLRGDSKLLRIRVGDYRIVYSVDDTKRIVDISVVRHRSEAYR